MKVKLNNTTIHYQVFGEGRPHLALHGWMVDHRYMVKLLEPAFENRKGWKRIYIDLPGHGKTPGSETIKNSDDVLDVVLEFIDSQIQGERFTLSGTSYGSILARGVMARRGDDVDGLLLVAPDIEHDPERAELPPRTLLVKDQAALAELQPHERGLFENDLVVQSPQALAILREVVFPAFGTGDREFLERLSRHYVLSFDVDALSRPFDRPTLFLMGRQDHRTGYRDVWPLIENYPRATFAVLDRAGHTIGGIEQVELSIALIGDWLDRVEENIATATA